jgi:hypothetical protein
MTALAADRAASALRRAAVRATLAPSVHNTQPWKLHLTKDGRLDVYPDRSRQLHVLDPTSRQLLISCGCAVMNARVSLAGSGTGVAVDRSRHPLAGDALATLAPADEPVDPALAALDPVVELRQTNRRQFSDDPVPESVLAALETAAAVEGAFLFVVREPDQRVTVASLSQRADDIENLNPAYRAELGAWTPDDPQRRDGVHPLSVPRADGRGRDDLPLRSFDTHGIGGLPAETRSSKEQTLVLLGTAGDAPAEWVRAGEALERVLLEITRNGFAASPLTQVTEVPATRAQLRSELRLTGYPHVLLRVGRAPITPTSRRRRLVEVLVDETSFG